jgi:hypothetical protein
MFALVGCFDYGALQAGLHRDAATDAVVNGIDSKSADPSDAASADFESIPLTDAAIAPDLAPACVEGSVCGAAGCMKFNGAERAYKHICQMGVCNAVSTPCGNGCCGSVCC